jgi:DNA-binding Lrp family transcriptional regulator
MLAIVRVRIRLKEKTERGLVALQTGNINKVWRRIVRNRKKWQENDARIVFLTHRSLQEDISLIFDAKNLDAIGDYVYEHVAPMKEVANIKIIPLINPRFFKPPKDTPRGMKRFTISIDVDPHRLDQVYNYLSNFKPTKGIVPVYLASTLTGFGRDLIFSVLCRGETTAKNFVRDYINSYKGITDSKTTHISQTKRLVTSDEWKKVIKRMTVKTGDFEIEDYEDFDEDWISSC